MTEKELKELAAAIVRPGCSVDTCKAAAAVLLELAEALHEET